MLDWYIDFILIQKFHKRQNNRMKIRYFSYNRHIKCQLRVYFIGTRTQCNLCIYIIEYLTNEKYKSNFKNMSFDVTITLELSRLFKCLFFNEFVINLVEQKKNQ